MSNIFFQHGKPTKVRFVVGFVFIMNFLFAFHSTDILAAPEIKIGDKVPNFVLEDPDENLYALEQMRGKVIILIMGCRKTKENNNIWAKVLLQTFPNKDSLEIFSVFDMRGIPFFVTKSFVRGKVKKMQEEHSETILLDWGQKVNKLLGADKDKTNIFVIDSNGILAGHQVFLYSEKKLKLLKEKIMELLEPDRFMEKQAKEEEKD